MNTKTAKRKCTCYRS